MANGFNAYQREMARRGLGSVFQTEGPERVGAGQRFTRSFDNREAGRANLTDVYGPDIPPYLMEDIFNVGGLLDQIVSAGSEAITPQAMTTADRRQQSAAIRREAGAPKTGLEEAEFFPSGLDPDKWQTPEDFVPFQPPKDWNVIEAKEPPKAGVPRIGEGPKKSMLAGGRGTVVEKPGERAAAAADPAEQGFMAAMQEYVNSARGADGATAPRSLDEYKKEFAEATGIDISGKVDKSQALMAFGLALMQNRAGKGFNVGRMLSAVGEAGEAALPALEKAKQEARGNAIAAGKYALESRSADKAKAEAARKEAMNRKKYWVYKKGAPGAEFAGFDQGEFVDLNAVELDRLINNKDFDSQYEFIDASTRFEILKKRAEGQDLGDKYVKPDRISLIGGDVKDVPPALQVFGALADPNYKGETPTKMKLLEDPNSVVKRFQRYQASINNDAERLTTLIKNVREGVSIPDQLVSKVVEAGRALGFEMGGVSTVSQAKQELKNIAIDEVLRILKESGRTISEGERQRVEKRVGDISMSSADPEMILNQIEYIYNMVVTNSQRNLDDAVDSLDRNFGISVGGRRPANDMPTEQELEAINNSRKSRGAAPLTMDDFK